MLSAVSQSAALPTGLACAALARLAQCRTLSRIRNAVIARKQSTMAVEVPAAISDLTPPDLPVIADAPGTSAAATMSTATASAKAAAGGSSTGVRDDVKISTNAAQMIDQILSKTNYGANIYRRERLSI